MATTTNTNGNKEESSSSALANLPSDIFTTLTSGFDLAAINTLRQVSHSLNAAATNELFTKCFAHRITDLSTKSLNDLIGVCSSEYGRYVESVTIRVSNWRLDELEKQIKEKAKWEANGPSNGPIFCSQQRKLTEDELTAVEKNLEVFKALNEDQAALQAEGKATALLAQAFQALGDRPVSIRVEARQYRESLEQGLPARGYYGEAADRVQKIMNDAFKITIAAVAQSDVWVDEFEIFHQDTAGHVSLDAFYDSFADLPINKSRSGNTLSIPRGISKLQKFWLTVSPAPYVETRPPIPEKYEDRIVEQNGTSVTVITPVTRAEPGEYVPASHPELHVLHLTTLRALLTANINTMTTLDVRIRGQDSKHLIDSATFLSNLPSLPNLQTLHLRGFTLSPSSLLSLLTPATHLTTLGLHRISLCKPPPTTQTEPDNRAWLPIFAHLTTLPSLTTFSANALYLNDFRTTIFPSSPASALARIPVGDYMTRIFFEGPPCVTFTGEEVRAERAMPDAGPFEPRTNPDGTASDAETPMGYDGVRWGAPTDVEEDGPMDIDEIGVSRKEKGRARGGVVGWLMGGAAAKSEDEVNGEKGEQEEMWTPIRYKIGKRRPLGSPWLYRWTKVTQWEYALF